MKCLSLFSGIGGFDLALKNLGHEIVGACEIDKHARQIYARHFPDVHIYEDATKINPHDLPDFDILVAGFPCQSFSIAGKRRGFDDTRGTLFFEIARIAKEKRPRYLLLENVKGLLSHEGGETIRTIFQTLDELGYDTQARIVNTKNYLPQNRERIFIVGHLRCECRPKVFPIRVSDEKSNVGKTTPKLTQIGNLGNNRQGQRVYDPLGISVTLTSGGGGQGAKTGLYAIPVLSPDRPIKRQNGRRFKEEGDPTFTITTQDRHGIMVGIKDGDETISNTIITGGRGSVDRHAWDIVNDGMQIRRLTPLECERLQGFPDNWTKFGVNGVEIADSQRYKCCGNAVSVPVAQDILSRIY